MGTRLPDHTPNDSRHVGRGAGADSRHEQYSNGRMHPIKRLREDSDTSARSIDTIETAKHVDYVKKLTLLEMQVTKLTEENKKLKIESEFKEQEKKYSFLRDDEEEKNKRDRIFNQRNSLFEKNKDLNEELDGLSETYKTFHKEMSEKNNKLLGEVGELNSKLLKITDDLFTERRKNAHELHVKENTLWHDITKREHRILDLENEVRTQTASISTLTEDVEVMREKVAAYTDLQTEEFALRMELDTLKNKEVYATVFPERILQSQQLHEENVRLQRDIRNMREARDHATLLKMQLEDKEKEVTVLQQQIEEQQQYTHQHDTLSADISDWKAVKEQLNLSSPLSIISNVSKLQKDALQMTSVIEKYKSELTSLTTELTELRATHDQLQLHASADSDKSSELRTRLTQCEAKCAEYREESESCRKLLETYQSTTEDDRVHLPKKPGLKILHMKHNPYQDRLDQQLLRLTEDNKKLKEQLESADNPARVLKDLELCKQSLAETESALKKTRTIYQAKVKTFKESVYELFGYSVTCPADNQYSLLSVFAESQDNTILFSKNDNNCMQLRDTSYTRTLDMQCHISKLTQHRSLPLFLSDITSDLFHRQTGIGGDIEYTCKLTK